MEGSSRWYVRDGDGDGGRLEGNDPAYLIEVAVTSQPSDWTAMPILFSLCLYQ